MKVVVSGNRTDKNRDRVWAVMNRIHRACGGISHLILTEEKGTDAFAAEWAKNQGIEVQLVLADWKKYGRVAGSIRNEQILDLGPDFIVVFEGGKGPLALAKKARVPVFVVRKEGR